MPRSPRIDRTRRQRIRPPQRGPNTCGWIPACQSELTALSQEEHRRPIWDQTGGTQVCVLQQKAAEEPRQFDKTQKPSWLSPKITAGLYHCARPQVQLRHGNQGDLEASVYFTLRIRC